MCKDGGSGQGRRDLRLGQGSQHVCPELLPLRPLKPQEGTVRKSSTQVKKLVTRTPRDCLVIDKLHLTPSDSALTVAGYA